MALLKSLQIRGIRSFGHESSDDQVIDFFTPATLFLGKNGSGKTTIIESLKYACSEELPPNAESGKCFVHDPKLSSLDQIRGQILLRFTDTVGREIAITKILQVTRQKDKAQFKSIPQPIKIRQLDGRVTELSSNDVYQYLGVSEPIINNVIFCQQDKALWPLDDGKKLKEKFDSIFNIDSYNKAIENLQNVIKNKNAEVTSLKVKLKYATELKDKVIRKQSNLADKRKEILTLENEMANKSDNLTKLYACLQEVIKTESELSELMVKLASKETEKDSIKKQQATLYESIIEKFDGSDEDLNREIESFETKCEREKNELQSQKDKLSKLEDNEEKIKDVVKKLQVKIGSLKAQQEQQESRIRKRNSQISKLATELDMPSDFNEDTIENLESCLATRKSNLQETQRKQKLEKMAIQNRMLAYEKKRDIALHDIELKKKDMEETQQKCCEISSKLHDLNVSYEQMNNYNQEIIKIEKELNSLNETFDSVTITSKMKVNKVNIAKLEREQEDIENDIKLLQKNYLKKNEIESKTSLLRKRESEINELKEKHRDSLKLLFKEIPTIDFKEAIQNRVFVIESDIKSVKKGYDGQRKIVTRMEFEKQSKDERYKKLKERLIDSKEIVRSACSGKPYERYVNELHLEIESLRVEKGELVSVEVLYKRYMKHLKEVKRCPVCETGFHDKEESVDKLINKMDGRIKRLPEDIKNVEGKLETKQNEHKELLQLNSTNDEIKEIETELPIIKQEIDDIETELTRANAILENQEETLTANNVDLKMCTDITGDCAIMDQYRNETKTIQIEITNLEGQLITLPSSMTLSAIDVKLEDIKEELCNTRKACDTLQERIDENNERRNELIRVRNSVVEKQLNLEKDVQGRPLLEDRKNELKKKEETLMETVEILIKEEFDLTKLVADEKTKFDELKETNQGIYERINDRYTQSLKIFDDIVSLQTDIQIYVDAKNEELFNKAKNNLCNYTIQERNINDTKAKLTVNINDVTRTLDCQSIKFRSLIDNLRSRDLIRDEKRIEDDVMTLRDELKNYDHKSIQEEKSTLQRRYVTIEKEIVYKEGNLDEIKKSVIELEEQLDMPRNRNAYNDYKINLFTFKITNRIINELNTYHKSLEDGIIMYHNTRMKHINMIVKDLWRNIYKGQDIEYIQIKASESVANKSRRMYNYKVVQYRNGVELDMSGRCSAGQKVLACLLIRMALAETFSHNCGIFALDEPTTNLDEDNIKSLADSLANIINDRKHQRNFQLLIITHDTYFMEKLRTLGCAEYYYKVSRQRNGTTLVAKEPL